MVNWDHWIDNKLVQNLFIWFLLFLILLTTIQSDNRLLSAIFAIHLLAPPIYVNNLLIIPLFGKKPFVFALLFVLNTLAFTAISVFLIQKSLGGTFEWGMFINFLGIMILALAFASALKFARDSFARRQQDKEAELKLLKGQLNPHFLFNTLNNLYGLSVAKSERLPSLMLKLSDLLRYSLYETKEQFVPLEKEIGYLENYISLEKIRLDDQTEIEFSKKGDFSKKSIAPMLFIVFVENAFKHMHVGHDKERKVCVHLNLIEDQLQFKCSNSIDLINKKEDNLDSEKSGIGLKNAKKRLELMYPNSHELIVNHHQTEYRVELNLDLQ
ncbi:MAG: histidine kinase [Maribacter sp.]|uniref:sensor histidine kinase n=1 Tax=Maribacter sp. TaxID=1897614 RepID=UPI003297684F